MAEYQEAIYYTATYCCFDISCDNGIKNFLKNQSFTKTMATLYFFLQLR